jgi:hypothetical protein
MTSHVGRLTAATVLVGVATLNIASCGQEKPAVCTGADELRASVRQLQNTNISENGLGSLTTALTQVRTELNQFSPTARTQFAPQLDEIRSAVDQTQGAVSTARADPSAAALGQVRVTLGGVQTAVDEFETAVKDTC